jgi:deazaflavin-dependent oxidoreductase (nitroreductase family)
MTMAATRNAMVELFWKVHPRLYRWSGGRIGGTLMGLPVLLLTTTGRKSGQPRTNALMYVPHGGDFVVIASVLGEPRHPFWWRNLEANPEASVLIGSTTYRVRAREAAGDEREALWRALVAKVPDYDEYRARTTRRIPVVVLERR